MRTFAAFLASPEFEQACCSGNTHAADYSLDDNAELVGLQFRGAYTMPELEALGADLRRVQDAWTRYRAKHAAPGSLFRVTAFCCRSGCCTECRTRGTHGDTSKRARRVIANKLSKARAQQMLEGWRAYGPQIELDR